MQRDTNPCRPPHRDIHASALIQDGDGRVLTIRLAGEVSYRLPGGYACRGEGAPAAMEYMVRQQIGLTVKPLQLLVVEDRHSGGEALTTEFVYAVRRVSGDAEVRLPRPDGRNLEAAAFQWLTLDENFKARPIDGHPTAFTSLQIRPPCVDDHCTKVQALQIRAAIKAETTGRLAELENGLPAYRTARPVFDERLGGGPAQISLRPERPALVDSHDARQAT
ncbi:NUDIX domain-containing protein [Streptomyces syringium]|uniref:NUDIX domain-containing protein n=1 Tax=Streptomyces syringium TaxID=76729 RepID=UPI0036AA9DB5